MEHITMNAKGQITIPVSIRKELNLKENSTFTLSKLLDGNLVLKKKKTVFEAMANIDRPKNIKKHSDAEIKAAIGKAIWEKHERIRKEWHEDRS